MDEQILLLKSVGIRRLVSKAPILSLTKHNVMIKAFLFTNLHLDVVILEASISDDKPLTRFGVFKVCLGLCVDRICARFDLMFPLCSQWSVVAK